MRKAYDFSKAKQGTHHRQYRQGHSVRLIGESVVISGSEPQKDKQLIELAGKHLLISRLIAAGYEVAEPLRDNGIDLLVYRGDENGAKFTALPIQLKVSSHESFSLDKKYSRIPKLLIAYVWNVHTPEQSDIYALTFSEALNVLKKKGHVDTDTWTKAGKWFVNHPGIELKEFLEPYRMTTERWQIKLQEV